MKLFFSVLFAFLLIAHSAETQIIFPDFPAEGTKFITLGDAAYNTANRSHLINAGATHSRGSCGVMLYKEKVRIQDVATGRAASFSTSFSFTFTSHLASTKNSTGNEILTEGSGFAFVFFRTAMFAQENDIISKHFSGQSGACLNGRRAPNPLVTPTSFAFIIATDRIRTHNDPSNSFIWITKNLDYEYDVGAYTHNLCGNDSHCLFFSNGAVFTAWIDFSSSLEVRLAKGFNGPKPLQPLLLIQNYTLPKGLGDEVYLAFGGSTDVGRAEAHELLSWSFFSTGIPNSGFLSDFLSAGITTGVIFGTFAALLILWFISRRSRRWATLSSTTGPIVFSYGELRKATDNFHEKKLLGSGGSGSVYRGSLEGGKLVAVKQISFAESKQAESLFHAEVSSLGQIRHRNVVQLHGWCEEKGRLLLVYDYMPNGGLNEWLHGSGRPVLSLRTRHSILEGVGAALEYLHEDCFSCILHRDVKSSNVLLDADLKAHLGDFGLARLMDHHKLDKTTMAAGTFGYMAPEMPYTGKATKESDVYSFGILVLEVVCGRRPLDLQTVEPEDLVLLYAVWQARENGSLLNVADPSLVQPSRNSRLVSFQDSKSIYEIKPPPLPWESGNLIKKNTSGLIVVDVDIEVHKTMVVNLLHLGLLCCLPNPKTRPSMKEVNAILQQIQDMENLSTFTTIAMPSLPSTKPLGLYHSLEFSQTAVK